MPRLQSLPRLMDVLTGGQDYESRENITDPDGERGDRLPNITALDPCQWMNKLAVDGSVGTLSRGDTLLRRWDLAQIL